VIAGLVAAYEDGRMSGIRIYDVAGRTYVGDVVEIPPRYGRDQLLAIMVPLDDIEKPVIEIRKPDTDLLDRLFSLCDAAVYHVGDCVDRPTPPRADFSGQDRERTKTLRPHNGGHDQEE
jgi:hypothetical protein